MVLRDDIADAMISAVCVPLQSAMRQDMDIVGLPHCRPRKFGLPLSVYVSGMMP